ncbi:MAG: hypothetical protein ACM3O7_05445 [Acidobacteriota bacterium]
MQRIARVDSRRRLRRFIELSYRLSRGDPIRVPPLRLERDGGTLQRCLLALALANVACDAGFVLRPVAGPVVLASRWLAARGESTAGR